MVTDRLSRTEEGRAALRGLDTDPGSPEARRRLRAALSDEIDADEEFAHSLSSALGAMTPAPQ
ncbi:hypothetical protein [Streptomyces sp. NPDC127039]